MVLSKYSVRRRRLFMSAIGVGLCLHPGFAQADLPGHDPSLDTAAIPVRNVAGVLLEAVARAGARLVAAGEHGVIIYSDDNGVSWTQARVPVDLTFTCIAFATPKIGWAAGHFGVVVRTDDGGESWAMQLNGLQVNQLTMTAAQAAVADNNTAAGAPFAMRRAQNFAGSGPSKPFLFILVLGPQKVLVVGAYRMTVMTTDGGKTWVDWSLQIEDRLSHNLYDGTIAGSRIYLVGETGLVFYSDQTANDFVQATSPGAVTLFGIIATADGGLLVFGVAGNAFHSTDGGKTWSTINFSTGDNLVAGRMLATGEILIASESGNLFKSSDNGLTFKTVPGVPPMAIFDLVQTADNAVVLVGIPGAYRLPASSLGS